MAACRNQFAASIIYLNPATALHREIDGFGSAQARKLGELQPDHLQRREAARTSLPVWSVEGALQASACRARAQIFEPAPMGTGPEYAFAFAETLPPGSRGSLPSIV